MEINSGDTAWVLVASALVMLMTPALGFFYGGLVRQKNVLGTIMHSFFILALISVLWVLCGYSLAFGPDHSGIIGDFSWAGFRNVGATPNADYATTIPHSAYAIFQMMFAIITPALITGSFAERKRFKAFVLFSIAWSLLVYCPLAHWVWSPNGWLHKLGALDFAGGTVVHISSGVSALIAALVLGKRVGLGKEKMDPHDLTMTVLGAGLLWFGWFGFNAGSALAANGLAVNAFLVTNTSAAMGALTWMTVSWLRHGRPSVLGAAAGAVAGLVAITPASGYVDALASIVIGFGAGIVCFFAVDLLKKVADDALDVFAVHGVGGIFGALATGIFAQKAINDAGNNGLLYGNPQQFLIQLVAVIATAVFAGAMTWGILKLIGLLVPLRVAEDEEVLGLDTTQHGEIAYQV